jgi:hypothetical protein
MNNSRLISSWRSHLASSELGLHLVDAEHPLEFYLGKTEHARPRVVIRTSEKPPQLTLSDVVRVERYQDESGKWNLDLTVQDKKFDEVFLRLVDNVHARSAEAPNERVAIDRVGVVIDEWRRLLKHRSSGVLSMEELRGLIGELWLIINEFSKIRSTMASIEGWQGPLGLPQDFWYPKDGYYEAKSIGPATNHFKISSELQLDPSEMKLLVLLVGSTDGKSPGAINLPMLTNHVLASLALEGASPDNFNERLTRLGVNLSEPFYTETWFVISHVTTYQVAADFPAIRASSLGPGIHGVRYRIDLGAIEDFKILSVDVV